MDLIKFHEGLFGQNPKTAEKALRVTPQQRRLYKAFPQARGFSLTLTQTRAWKDPERLTATLVLALAQARGYEDREVFFFLPSHYKDWVLSQIKRRAQYALQCRDDLDEKGLIRKVVGQLSIHSGFGEMEEPEHWAAFGFCSAGDLPDWIKPRLIKASG